MAGVGGQGKSSSIRWPVSTDRSTDVRARRGGGCSHIGYVHGQEPAWLSGADELTLDLPRLECCVGCR